jgi:hypothetical protein
MNKIEEAMEQRKESIDVSSKAAEFINIPSFVFKDRSLSVLEVMVEYMRDNKKMRFHEIASILNRDDRTVWTVYRRAKLKRKGIIRQVSVVGGDVVVREEQQ